MAARVTNGKSFLAATPTRVVLGVAVCTGLGVALTNCEKKPAANAQPVSQSSPAPTPTPAPATTPTTTPATTPATQPNAAQPRTTTPPAHSPPVPGKPQTGLPIEEVSIGGKTFKLELAAEQASREKGLSDRTSIAADGGMLFAFPDAQRLNFVMRDCPIAIDILFLDPTGRIVAQHRMKAEEARRPGEADLAYNQRLRLYPSGYGAQFAIELKEGSLDQLKLKNGDQIKLDLERLKQSCK